MTTFDYDTGPGYYGQPLVPQKQKKSGHGILRALGRLIKRLLILTLIVGTVFAVVKYVNPLNPGPCGARFGQPVNLNTALPEALGDRFEGIEQGDDTVLVFLAVPVDGSVANQTATAKDDTSTVLQCVANSDNNDLGVFVWGNGYEAGSLGEGLPLPILGVGYHPDVYNDVYYGIGSDSANIWNLSVEDGRFVDPEFLSE